MAVDIQRVEQALHSLLAYDIEKEVFCTAGKASNDSILLPGLLIPEMEEISIPITPKEFKILKSCATEVLNSSGNHQRADQRVVKCWEVDISNVYTKGTEPWKLLIETVTPLALQGLINLKVDPHDTKAISMQPRRLLIYENGSFYDKSQDEEPESGVFATMHVQIPVKRGYSGGSFEIFYGNQSKIFDFSSESSEAFYYAIFNSDCFHRMLPVTGGLKVVLVCTLSLRHPRPIFRKIQDRDDGFLTGIRAEISKALAGWRNSDDKCFGKLAIPLVHHYTTASLSFTYLKGTDRLTASLLESIEFIDLHLTISCQSLKDDNAKTNTEKNKRKRRKTSPQNEAAPDMLTEEKITEYWVSAFTEAPFPFSNLKVEPHEIVQPDRESNGYAPKECFNNGPLREKCYYNAMLVIWPSISTVDFACRHGFVGALDILELLYKEKQKEELLLGLKEVVMFCRSNPSRVWCLSTAKDGEVTCRLLRLCTQLSNAEQGLIVLDLIAQDFPENSEITKKFEGIPTKEVASTVAQLVRLAGWGACAESIYKIISFERLALQTEPLMRFVSSLLDCGLLQSAKEVADHVCAFIFAHLEVSKVDSKTNEAIGELMFRLKEFDGLLLSQQTRAYINWLGKLDTQLLCELVIYLRRNLAALIKREPRVKALYLDLCFVLVNRRFECGNFKPVTEKPLLADVLQCLLWPKNVKLIQSFIHQVTRPTTGNNQALEDLVTSRFVWQLCLPSLNGKLILVALTEARLQELSRLKEPVFDWRMPEAVVPNEPELESFLRSSRDSTVLPHLFHDMAEARSWAMNIFGSFLEILPSPDSSFFRTCKYSAVPKFIKLPGGFTCEISKNNRLHEYNVRKFSLQTREKESLVELYRTKLSDVKERTLGDLKLDNSFDNSFDNKRVMFNLN